MIHYFNVQFVQILKTINYRTSYVFVSIHHNTNSFLSYQNLRHHGYTVYKRILYIANYKLKGELTSPPPLLFHPSWGPTPTSSPLKLLYIGGWAINWWISDSLSRVDLSLTLNFLSFPSRILIGDSIVNNFSVCIVNACAKLMLK